MNKWIIFVILVAILATVVVAFEQTQPVYRTETFQDPVYGTVYTGYIDVADSALFGLGWKNRRVYLYEADNPNYNIVNFKYLEQYTNWGIDLYNVQLYYAGGSTQVMGNVNKVDLVPSQKIVGYNTKSRQVCVKNC